MVVGCNPLRCISLTHNSTCDFRRSVRGTSANDTDLADKSIVCRVPDSHTCRADQSRQKLAKVALTQHRVDV